MIICWINVFDILLFPTLNLPQISFAYEISQLSISHHNQIAMKEMCSQRQILLGINVINCIAKQLIPFQNLR